MIEYFFRSEIISGTCSSLDDILSNKSRTLFVEYHSGLRHMLNWITLWNDCFPLIERRCCLHSHIDECFSQLMCTAWLPELPERVWVRASKQAEKLNGQTTENITRTTNNSPNDCRKAQRFASMTMDMFDSVQSNKLRLDIWMEHFNGAFCLPFLFSSLKFPICNWFHQFIWTGA